MAIADLVAVELTLEVRRRPRRSGSPRRRGGALAHGPRTGRMRHEPGDERRQHQREDVSHADERIPPGGGRAQRCGLGVRPGSVSSSGTGSSGTRSTGGGNQDVGRPRAPRRPRAGSARGRLGAAPPGRRPLRGCDERPRARHQHDNRGSVELRERGRDGDGERKATSSRSLGTAGAAGPGPSSERIHASARCACVRRPSRVPRAPAGGSPRYRAREPWSSDSRLAICADIVRIASSSSAASGWAAPSETCVVSDGSSHGLRLARVAHLVERRAAGLVHGRAPLLDARRLGARRLGAASSALASASLRRSSSAGSSWAPRPAPGFLCGLAAAA